jgi:SWI/SNF-related matrix-associated actin-dependent regulator of chromatin subfamily A-like protein 1
MIDLFPYQNIGSEWLRPRKMALLADDCGLGKSAQVIRASDDLSRLIILCPAVARLNWANEFEKFSNNKNRKYEVWLDGDHAPHPTNSIIASFDIAMKHHSKWGRFDLLIIDETHYLKNPIVPEGKIDPVTKERRVPFNKVKAVFGKGGLVHHADRVWALSGTPAPNHAGELWVLLYTFGVTKLKYEQFLNRYCDTHVVGFGPRSRTQISGTKRAMIPELRGMLKQIMLRRKKEDVLKELPPIFYTSVVVQAGAVSEEAELQFMKYVTNAEQKLTLAQILQSQRKRVEQALTEPNMLRALEAISESVSTLRRYTALQKLPSAIELIRSELEMGLYDKVVIFAIHRDVIQGLADGLSEFRAVMLHGGTTPKAKDYNITLFQNDPRCRVFIGNIDACGTAITLTAANNVVLIEESWVPGKNAQAIMRVHRIGQLKNVFARRVTIQDSIDRRVGEVLRKKTQELAEIFDEGLAP